MNLNQNAQNIIGMSKHFDDVFVVFFRISWALLWVPVGLSVSKVLEGIVNNTI